VRDLDEGPQEGQSEREAHRAGFEWATAMFADPRPSEENVKGEEQCSWVKFCRAAPPEEPQPSDDEALGIGLSVSELLHEARYWFGEIGPFPPAKDDRLVAKYLSLALTRLRVPSEPLGWVVVERCHVDGLMVLISREGDESYAEIMTEDQTEIAIMRAKRRPESVGRTYTVEPVGGAPAGGSEKKPWLEGWCVGIGFDDETEQYREMEVTERPPPEVETGSWVKVRVYSGAAPAGGEENDDA